MSRLSSLRKYPYSHIDEQCCLCMLSIKPHFFLENATITRRHSHQQTERIYT